jgi:sec-independent protein translocase protein TatC
MAELHEDDLFRHSSMSFGEHLDELRRRLFRAAGWLLAGVIIGFIIGKPVVKLIEQPMESALKEFYENKTRADLDARGGDASDEEIIKAGFIGEQAFVQPGKVVQELSKRYSGIAQPKATAPPAESADDLGLLPMTIWHKSSDDHRIQLTTLNASEAFLIYLKAAMLTGVIFASPMIFREIWGFVAAGLYPHERRYVHIFLPFSLGLFLAGVLMAFFIAFPPVLKFLLGFNQFLGISPEPRIEEWLSFVLFLPLAFGIGFQLPLVMLFVNRIGLVSVATFRKQWRIAILTIFVIAMILTPSPDVYSMSLMALPMTLLYFGGIALCAYTSGRRPAGLGRE